MKLKQLYTTPCTDEITIRTESNFVATGDIHSGETGTSSIPDLEEDETYTGIWGS